MRTQPQQSQLELAKSLHSGGDLVAALAAARAHLVQDPNALDALNLVAVIQCEAGDLDGAITDFAEITRRLPENAHVHHNLAVALKRARRWDEALEASAQAVNLSPDHKPARAGMGACLLRLNRTDEALAVLRTVARDWPEDPDAQVDLGVALAATHRPQAAKAAYQQALAIAPDHPAALVKLGETLQGQGDLAGAEALLRRAHGLEPHEAAPLTGLAYCSLDRRDLNGAELLFLQALERDPTAREAHYGLAHLLSSAERHEDAIKHLDQVIAQDPEHDEARASRLYAAMRLCDWSELRESARDLSDLGCTGRAITPFALIPLEDDPHRMRQRAEAYARARFGGIGRWQPQQRRRWATTPRVGFFSADFHDHATLYLMAGLFEHLDRTRFDPMIFSYGPNRDDAMRHRLQETGLPFFDISAMSDLEIADLSRQMTLDIAIDLKGHTQGNRLGPFARGLAPLQIHYLGYPGPLGCDFIDYLMVDPTLVTADTRDSYGEALITLPGCYQVTDNARPPSGPAPDRAALGLPETGPVLASFNDPYKITPEVFAIWMRLLADQPQAVLWLYAPLPAARDNLRATAPSHGIAAERLIFADRAPQSEHIARMRRADLFLDTFPCCAHTTASDALWAGLPLVTRTGDSFHARVAASLLDAAGLPDCITPCAASYEDRIHALLADPRRLRDLRRRTEEVRHTGPLFDTQGFTCHFEDALEAVLERYLNGDPPADIRLGP